MLRLRRPSRTRAVIGILVAAFVIAGLGGARAGLFARDRAKASTIADAVKRFRQGGSAAAALEGVYTVQTVGRESIDALGGAHHRYPARTSMTARRSDCGLRLEWRPLQARANRWELCSTPAGVELRTSSEQHHFFFQTDTTTYTCEDELLFAASADAGAEGAAAAPRPFTCTTGKEREDGHVIPIGRETLTVGGRRVVAEHVRTVSTITGGSSGTETTDWWLDTATALPVRVILKSRSARKTIVGTAHYSEDAELRLASLTPSR